MYMAFYITKNDQKRLCDDVDVLLFVIGGMHFVLDQVFPIYSRLLGIPHCNESLGIKTVRH